MAREKKQDLLRKKYYLFALAVFLMFIIVSLLIFFFSIQKQSNQDMKDFVLRSISRQSEQVELVVNLELEHLASAADYMGRTEGLSAQERQSLLASLQGQTGLKRVGIMDASGQMIYDDGEEEDVSQEIYFEQVMEGQQVVTDPMGGEKAGEAQVIFAVPILNDGKVTGGLAGIYDVAGLSELLFYGGYQGDGYVLVATAQGEAVALSFYDRASWLPREGLLAYSQQKGDSGETERLKEALGQGETGFMTVRWEGKDYCLTYQPVGINDWVVCYSIPSGLILSKIHFFQYAEAILFGAILSGAVLLLIFIRAMNHKKEESLLQVAQTDALTGLLNKKSTEEKIDSWLSSGNCQAVQAFLMMDIDRFKEINDVYGHVLGDEVLRRIGKLLREFFREGDLVGRIGGDEFVVLMKNIPSAQHALERARQLSGEMKKIQIRGMEGVQFTGSMGLAVYPNQGSTYLELYRCADEALYTIKRNGRDGCAMC